MDYDVIYRIEEHWGTMALHRNESSRTNFPNLAYVMVCTIPSLDPVAIYRNATL